MATMSYRALRNAVRILRLHDLLTFWIRFWIRAASILHSSKLSYKEIQNDVQ
jgi:hypothetical protein